MHHRETARVAFEIGQRVFACHADPAEIHFHLDEFRVGRFEEVVVCQFAVEAGIRRELPPVIVISKLNPRFSRQGIVAANKIFSESSFSTDSSVFAGVNELPRRHLPVEIYAGQRKKNGRCSESTSRETKLLSEV